MRSLSDSDPVSRPIKRKRPQQHTMMMKTNPICGGSSRCWLISCMMTLALLTSSMAFQVTMTTGDPYKPPVKSSVKKLYDRRYGGGESSSSASRSGGGSISTPHHQRSSAGRLTSSAKSAHAGTLSMPQPRSFEERMRDMVLGPQRMSAPPATEQRRVVQRQRSALPPNVQTIETLEEYKRVVGDEREKIVAVRFYATYCKACKAVAPHFYKMARDFPDTIFVDVPVTDKNPALHQGLGVTTLPFAHIYHPTAGLVEEHKLTRKDVAAFQEKLKGYVDGSIGVPE